MKLYILMKLSYKHLFTLGWVAIQHVNVGHVHTLESKVS